MTINIVTNTYGRYHRQDVAVRSWRYLTRIYPSIVNVWDTKAHIKKSNYDNDDAVTQYRWFNNNSDRGRDFESYGYVLPLKKWSRDFIGGAKNLPCVKEIIQQGVALGGDADYTIFTNSDVIIMPNLIERILHTQPKAIACSRMDIRDIDSFKDVLDRKLVPVRYEIAGFDTFVFKNSWWKEHEDKFQEYLLGKPLWDVVYAGIVRCFGDYDELLGNKVPPHCFHIHHGLASVLTEDIEKAHNMNLCLNTPLDMLLNNIMFTHLKTNLLKRTPFGSFLHIPSDEDTYERQYFHHMNVHTDNIV